MNRDTYSSIRCLEPSPAWPSASPGMEHPPLLWANFQCYHQDVGLSCIPASLWHQKETCKSRESNSTSRDGAENSRICLWRRCHGCPPKVWKWWLAARRKWLEEAENFGVSNSLLGGDCCVGRGDADEKHFPTPRHGSFQLIEVIS